MAELSSAYIIKPSALEKGDTVAIVSPASTDKGERFDKAHSALQKIGFNVVEGGSARLGYRYLAGNDVARADDFNRFLKDDTVSAIIASRGGYGCSRILPLIDYEIVMKHPKIILGGSDLTALLWAIYQKTGLVTFFGPMALQIGEGLNGLSEDSLWRALKGKITESIILPQSYNPYPIRGGKIHARLIGGCLSLVVSLLGTEYFGNVKGKILFLEEIGEKPYRIDRMLTHLRNAGVFEQVSGLLLGDFHKCWNDDDDFTLPEIVNQVLGEREIPVLAGLPFGHREDKMTLPLGIEVELDADKGEFRFLEEAVSE